MYLICKKKYRFVDFYFFHKLESRTKSDISKVKDYNANHKFLFYCHMLLFIFTCYFTILQKFS